MTPQTPLDVFSPARGQWFKFDVWGKFTKSLGLEILSLQLNYRGLLKGARSRFFRYFCLILLIMNSKRQIDRARVFHLQNHGHITTENDFPAV